MYACVCVCVSPSLRLSASVPLCASKCNPKPEYAWLKYKLNLQLVWDVTEQTRSRMTTAGRLKKHCLESHDYIKRSAQTAVNRGPPASHLTPSLPLSVTFPGWKMHPRACKQYFPCPITNHFPYCAFRWKSFYVLMAKEKEKKKEKKCIGISNLTLLLVVFQVASWEWKG